MNWKSIFILLLISTFPLVWAQDNSLLDKLIKQEKDEMDSIQVFSDEVFDTIHLDNAQLLHLNLKTDMEKKYYVWLRKRVRDVWPYVKVAVEEYNAIQDTSQYFTNKKERKKYIKKRQAQLADQFEKQLKDLSLSRGQILIKLIHRETGMTSYEIIKEMRGGVNAFLWNSAGGAYNLDLKSEFNPHKVREDLFIEVILRKDFQSGRLQPIDGSD